jgi:hypothetical protein
MTITKQLESLTQDEINFIYEKFEKAINLVNEELQRKEGLIDFTKGMNELITKHLKDEPEKASEGEDLIKKLEEALEQVKKDIKMLQNITDKFKSLVDIIN